MSPEERRNGDPRLRKLERQLANIVCLDNAHAHMAAEAHMRDQMKIFLEKNDLAAARMFMVVGLSHRAMADEYYNRILNRAQIEGYGGDKK